ncbi:hypothetical protein HR12_43830, partial [Microbacterium sp. SUBG005]
EYVAIAGSTAYVALQEANAVATVDLVSAEVTGIRSLGFKDYGVETLDASDRDPEDAPTYTQKSYPAVRHVHARRHPGLPGRRGDLPRDRQRGRRSRVGDYNDTARVKDLGDDGLAPVCADSPLAGSLGDDGLGRLNVATDMR